MPDFKIFTNDRDYERGTPMYSCLKTVTARDKESALKKCPPDFTAPNCAPAHAIRWPESEQSPSEKAWLKKHVG